MRELAADNGIGRLRPVGGGGGRQGEEGEGGVGQCDGVCVLCFT
jgi:hypothetical protein